MNLEIMTCLHIQCGPNAVCQEVPGAQPECRCLPGYIGDGLYCYEHTGIEIPGFSYAIFKFFNKDYRQLIILCTLYSSCQRLKTASQTVVKCETFVIRMQSVFTVDPVILSFVAVSQDMWEMAWSVTSVMVGVSLESILTFSFFSP